VMKANTYCSSTGYHTVIDDHYFVETTDKLSRGSRASHSSHDAMISVLEFQRSECADYKLLQLGIHAHLMSDLKSRAAPIMDRGAKCFGSSVSNADFVVQRARGCANDEMSALFTSSRSISDGSKHLKSVSM